MAKKHTEESAAPAPKRRRWLLVAMLVLVGLGWFAPSLVMRTPLKRSLLDYGNPGINGAIDFDTCELGWLSPVMIRGVRVTDLEGNVVAEADAVASKRTLWNLAKDYTNLGEFSVSGVQAKLTATPTGSNLEEIIAPLFEGPSSTDKYKYRINVSDASVVMTNLGTGRSSQLTDIKGYVQSTDLGNGYPDIGLELQAHPDEALNDGGELQCTLGWVPATADTPIVGKARVRGTAVSLQTFAPVVYRLMPDAYLDGQMKCDFALEWADDFTSYRFRGGLAADDFAFASPTYLGRDQLRSARVQLGGNVDLVGDALSVDQLRAKADFADVTANGTLELQDGVPVPGESTPFALSGEVNVADIVNRLPNTIPLQDGMRMTEGTAKLSLSGTRSEADWVWNGDVETGSIRGAAAGQEITWDDPLALSVRVRNHQKSFVVEQVSATSDFLTVTGKGTLDQLRIDGTCDLDQLKQRLQQFVDLGDWQLAGAVVGNANFKKNAGGLFAADAAVRATNFAATMQGSDTVWRENDMRITARAEGQVEQGTLSQVQSFSAKLTSGADTLAANLTQPVAAEGLETLSLPIGFRVEGGLDTWLARVQPVASVPVKGVIGQLDLQGSALVSTTVVDLQSCDIELNRVRLPISEDLIITEPQITAKVVGTVDLTAELASIKTLELRGTSLQAAAKEVQLAYGKPFKANAKIAVVGDLARIQQWQPSAAASEPWTGRLRGDLVVEGKGRLIISQLDATLRESNLLSVLDVPADRVASNPNAPVRPIGTPATLSCTLRYDRKVDELKIKKARVDSDAISIQVDGAVAGVTTDLATDVSGKIAYDFEHLNALLRASFGDHIKVKGRGAHPFRVKGPLSGDTTKLAGSARLSWDGATVYGLECGKGEVKASITEGVVRTEPIKFSLNGGTARLLPMLDLRESPTLHVGKGTAIKNVRLTEEVTSEWLKFVAPLLSDSARIQGQFSASVSGAVVPLNDPVNGDIAGSLQIHSAQAEPGPLVARLIGIVNQVRTLIGKRARGTDAMKVSVPEQNIQFRMVQQRVHHQNFQLVIDGVPIRTAGSVGLDQSLQLTAELSLPEKWLGSGSIARSLAGRPLKIPITGTLTRPRLDPGVLQNLGRNAAGGAANDLLKNNLDRGLNKLLDKIK
ncbi:MAG: hypothetical protein AB8G99_07850 [Planctomycetaceae bacterium]